MIKTQRYLALLFALLVLPVLGGTSSHAQQSDISGTTSNLATELQEYGDIDLFVFDGRADFLARIDETLGLANIKNPDKTFAKLPRSPFTITGRQNGAALATCHIFVPANITPETGNEIFAQLLRGWFGKSLNYASSPDLTYRWLIHHEARHCKPDHFGGDDIQNHSDEIEADLFAFDALAGDDNQNALRTDVIAFRMITSALIADKSHMIGLSIKRALKNRDSAISLSADQEIKAFLTARQMIGKRAKAIATSANPTDRDLVRAITELREEVQRGELVNAGADIGTIFVALDDAIAHFAPRLHGSVSTRKLN